MINLHDYTDAIHLELIYSARILLACFLGGCVGWEREEHDREAGIRTYAVVSLAACVFSIISQEAAGKHGDPSRIAAEVLSGLGFLGAGVILVQRGHILGLTTAATLWSTAAVGLAVGFGMYVLAISTTAIIYFVLAIKRWPVWMHIKEAASTTPRQADATADKKS